MNEQQSNFDHFKEWFNDLFFTKTGLALVTSAIVAIVGAYYSAKPAPSMSPDAIAIVAELKENNINLKNLLKELTSPVESEKVPEFKNLETKAPESRRTAKFVTFVINGPVPAITKDNTFIKFLADNDLKLFFAKTADNPNYPNGSIVVSDDQGEIAVMTDYKDIRKYVLPR